jgi:hypothetical protein
MKFIGEKILTTSKASKIEVTNLKTIVDSLQTRYSAMFGVASKKKGGAMKLSGQVGLEFQDLTLGLNKLVSEQSKFEADTRTLLTTLQKNMASTIKQKKNATAAAAAAAAASTISHATEASGKSNSLQLKNLKQEIAKVTLRVDALGQSHETTTKKYLSSVRKSISKLEETFVSMSKSAKMTNADAKQARDKLQTDLKKVLDKNTLEVKKEIQRVSSELGKQNSQTLKELQQVEKSTKQSMEKLKKEAVATSASAKAATKEATAATAAAAKASKLKTSGSSTQAGKLDRDEIVKLIQSNVRDLIKEYRKKEKTTRAPSRHMNAAGAAKGAITQEMITGWIDNAVETFAADRTGRVDYAIHSSGSRIVGIGDERMTSATYLNPNTTMSRKAARALGLAMYHGPEEIIKPTSGIGR